MQKQKQMQLSSLCLLPVACCLLPVARAATLWQTHSHFKSWEEKKSNKIRNGGVLLAHGRERKREEVRVIE